ncbi:MAG: tetratricopeptide repeat protein [Planctomycetota bacterium]
MKPTLSPCAALLALCFLTTATVPAVQAQAPPPAADDVRDIPAPPGLADALEPIDPQQAPEARATLDQALEGRPLPDYLRHAKAQPDPDPDPDPDQATPDRPVPFGAQLAFARGKTAMLDGNAFRATRFLEAALRQAPDNPTLLRTLGRAYAQAGNRVKAARFLQRAVAQDPTNLDAIFYLARQALDRDQFDVALPLFAHLQQQAEPDSPLAFLTAYHLGDALRELGYLAAAQPFLEQALNPPPQSMTDRLMLRELRLILARRAQTLGHLGDLAHRLNQPAQALARYQSIDRKTLSDSRALELRLIYSHLRLNQPAPAEAIALDLLRRGLPMPQGVALIEYLRRVSPDPAGLAERLRAGLPDNLRQGPVLRAMIDLLPPEQAIAALEDRLKQDPTDQDAFEHLLQALLQLPADAEADPEQGSPHGRALDAAAARIVSLPDQAARTVRLLFEAEPDAQRLLTATDELPQATQQAGPATQAIVKTLAGLALERQNQSEAAIEAFHAALDLDANARLPRTRLILLALEADQIEQADALLQPIVEATDRQAISLRVRVLNARGETEPALALLDTLDQADAEPDERTEMLMLKAVLEFRLKQPQRAEGTLLSLLDANPTHEPAYAMLFELYEDDPAQHDKINPLFRRMAAALPKGRLTRLKLAQAYIAAGQHNRARALLRSLLADDPDDATALRGELTIALRTGDNAAAAELFERLLQLTPRDLGLLNQAAQFYFDNDESDKGLRVRQRALQLRPFSPETAYLIAAIHHELDEHEEAVAVVDRAIDAFDRISNAQPLAGVRADALIALDRPEDAIAVTEALFNDPRFSAFESGTRFQLAMSLDDAGFRDRSIKVLLLNVARFPTHAPSCNSLGYTFTVQDRNLRAAETLIKRALKVEPDSAAYLDSLGWVYYKLGDAARAIAWLDRSIKRADAVALELNRPLHGMRAVLLDHLGDAQHLAGNTDEAVKLWKRAAGLELTDADKASDPELATMAERTAAKLVAAAAGDPIPIANVPGDAALGPPLSELLKPYTQDPAPPARPAAPAPAGAQVPAAPKNVLQAALEAHQRLEAQRQNAERLREIAEKMKAMAEQNQAGIQDLEKLPLNPEELFDQPE